MSAIVALLYDAAARRSDRAGISRALLRTLRREVPPAALRAIDDLGPAFDPFLTSQSLTEIKNVGFVGVPFLSSDEVDFWLSHFEFVEELGRQARSWELWRTEDENYVLIPSSDYQPLALNVCAVVVTGSTVQLRTFVSGLAVDRDRMVTAAPPRIEAETCVYTDKVHDPGAPYQGSCVSDDDACPNGCSPQVVVSPSTGLYRIRRCACKG